MQNKYSTLPNVILNKITNELSTQALFQLMQVDKRTYLLFKTGSSEWIKPALITRFLKHVVQGEHYAVEKMLKLRPELLYLQGQVTDLSGRIFTHISGFEYALWALDKHMWTKMLACLSKNEEEEKIKAELKIQYQQVKERGVTYTLHGVTPHYMPKKVTKTEHHFDFEGTIFKQLQKYMDNNDDIQWRTGVGGAQRLLPIHVVYEYCSDMAFSPVPKFEKQPKSSTQFCNWLNEGEQASWFESDSNIGREFAVYKQEGVSGSEASPTRGGFAAYKGSRSSLKALKGLLVARTNDLLALENELNPSNLLENYYKKPS